MKNIKKVVCIMFALLLAFLCAIPIAAQENITNETVVTPRLSHCGACLTTFAISDSGIAKIYVQYDGYPETFVEAKVTVKIQKRFLGLFWKTVDIGDTNDEWVAYSNEVYGSFRKTFSVDGTGTYRAKFKIEIRGTDGTVDVIEKTVEYVYS